MTTYVTLIKVCNTCKRNNKRNFKYGKLIAKKAEAIPQDRLLVYIIGLYKIIIEGHDNPLILKLQ